MAVLFDLVLKNGHVATPGGIIAMDVAVKDGRIADFGSFSADTARETIDCTGLHVLPGAIDTQVHFREPGLTHKEDLATGTLSAIAGGVTTVFEMPNTNPLTTSRETFEAKIAAGTNRMHCDFAFYIGGTHENVGELAVLEKLPGCAGVREKSLRMPSRNTRLPTLQPRPAAPRPQAP